ncbi:S26 family signal peptidase, partial [Streptococcus pyogenes]
TALLRVFVFQVFQVPSGSMEETLELKDRIVAMRVSDFERGDIVVFEDPDAMWMGVQPASTNPVREVLEALYLLPDSSQ